LVNSLSQLASINFHMDIIRNRILF